jgi:release factor glutamine methyltransferase
MFVSSNQLIDVLPYYLDKLQTVYTKKEIINIFYTVCDYKHGLSKVQVKLSAKRLSESELLMHRSIIKRLLNNEPIQHIIGEVEFYGLPFNINKNVLIPRPETEELVDLIIKQHDKINPTILDIGTGSGCIPISLKHNIPNSKIYAIDVSEKALTVAKENAIKNNVDITFILADVLKEDLKILPQFDIIISNPPYVLQSDKLQMDENVLKFDPHLALFVDDETPLLFYNRIVELSKHLLKSKGKLYFEIHEKLGREVKLLMENHQFKNVCILKDMQGKDRMIIGIK